jgi:hypothetical protein
MTRTREGRNSLAGNATTRPSDRRQAGARITSGIADDLDTSKVRGRAVDVTPSYDTFQ